MKVLSEEYRDVRSYHVIGFRQTEGEIRETMYLQFRTHSEQKETGLLFSYLKFLNFFSKEN